MAITKTDIALKAHQVMTDADDGGGRMTATSIADNQINNMFPDMSRLDRTLGRVSLRKASAAVTTDTTEQYYGAHLILTDPPDDNNVSVSMFSTNSSDDRRTDAQNAVESYVIRGVLARWSLYDTQVAGQKVLLMFAPVGVELPEIGEVLNIVENIDTGSEYDQFVKVTDVSFDEQSFNDSQGTFKKNVITVSIGTALAANYAGHALTRTDPTGGSVIRKTSVADITKYYSVARLAVDAPAGDLSLSVDSIYTSLVPSAQSDTALADVSAGGSAAATVDNGQITGVEFFEKISLNINSGSVIELNISDIKAGSLSVKKYGRLDSNPTNKSAPTDYTDDGNGNLQDSFGNTGFTVDYDAKQITAVLTFQNQWNSIILEASYISRLQIIDIAQTANIPVDISSRSITYVKTLKPIPAPGSLIIDYMAQGNWFRLRDDGTGSIIGDKPNTGTATLNFVTGTVIVTLAALPDVDSAVLFSWGTDAHYNNRAGDVDVESPAIEYTTPEGVITPSSLTISWTSNAISKTATDDGAGNLTGDGVGRVVYSTGQFFLKPDFNSALPDPASSVIVDYDHTTVITDNFNLTADVSGFVDFTLSQTPVKANSVQLKFTTKIATESGEKVRHGTFDGNTRISFIPNSPTETVVSKELVDDGLGGLPGTGSTISYATGVVHLLSESSINKNTYSSDEGGWSNITATDSFEVGGLLSATYILDTATPTTSQQVFAITPLKFNLTPLTTEHIIPGSIRFTGGGDTYIDRSGEIYRSIDPATGAGTLAGTVNYQTGAVILTNWSVGAGAFTLVSMLTQFGDWTSYEVAFRTLGSPLKPASLSIFANKAVDSSLMNDTADNNGVLSTADLEGHINVSNGVAHIKFGRWIPDDPVAQALPWYGNTYSDGAGNVWQPEPVIPSTIKYNAVAFSYLPLDAGLIGIDATRLPDDGRVPIFRDGDVIVIHSSSTENLPAGLIADQVVVLSGTDYQMIELYDADDNQVDYTLYTVDLVAGSVTMANPLDLSAYSQPLYALKRYEDMKLLSDVEINGDLQITSQLAHSYTAANTYVSSALTIGDMGSRLYNMFDQQTWTSVWDDNLIGSESTAQYNDVTYPPVVTNKGAIDQRWALVFTSSTAFDIIGETVGVIGTGNTSTVTNPVNPEQSVPYFQLDFNGWGAGWSTGNVLRFNTEAANFPIWFSRTTLPGEETVPTDKFTVQIRGDA